MKAPKLIEGPDGSYVLHVWYDIRLDDWRECIEEAKRLLDPDDRAAVVMAWPART